MVIRYIPVKHHPVPVEPSLLVAQCEKAGFARSSSALKKHVCDNYGFDSSGRLFLTLAVNFQPLPAVSGGRVLPRLPLAIVHPD